MSPTLYVGLPPRKLAELIAALYGLAMGCFGWVAEASGGNPFYWAAWPSHTVAGLFLASAVLHGLGVWINGAWRWSPVLRLIGMSAHASVILLLLLSSLDRWSSATPNYAFILFLFSVAWLASFRDTMRAVRGDEQEWTL